MIIVYARSGCRPCEQVKEVLSQAGVLFSAHDEDEHMSAYDALLARGLRRVPVTSTGDRVVKCYAPAALSTALAESRAAAAVPPSRYKRGPTRGHTPSGSAPSRAG